MSWIKTYGKKIKLTLDGVLLRDYEKHLVKFRRTVTNWETSANSSNNPWTLPI